ncbi:MAG: MerC domain-containing protein [Bradymonadia bacterium]
MTRHESNTTDEKRTVDRLGAFASSMCAIHCAVCAFLPTALALLGLDFLSGHGAEWAFTVLAVLIGLVAGIEVWRSHRRPSVLILFAIGIIGLLSARILEGGAHHEEHGQELHQETHEANEVNSNAHAKSKPDHHEDKHSDHEESHHLSIELLGILSGLVLMGGHLINLRKEKTDSVDDECCA